MSFSQLGVGPALCTALSRMGYTRPTPVQSAAIPIVLKGSDLLARAQTGTGKTAAFALPMIERLLARGHRARTRGPLGLVLVPTRELAVQVHGAIAAFGAPADLRVAVLVGGNPIPPQVRALKAGPDIVVATPGRLIDHLQRRTIDLSGIGMLTLDEADRMLDMGFLPSLRRILQALPRARQTLLFSATLPAAVTRLSAEFTREPARVDVSNDVVVAPAIKHRVHPVDLDRKRELLLHVLRQAPVGQALVFCKTRRGADRVGKHLLSAGLKTAVIHGDKGQAARTRSLSDFTTGRVNVLVATDIAARGLDVARLPLVVNYDLPLAGEDYVHRVGRTGRAGLGGRAISLVTSSDRHLLPDIQQLLAAPLEHVVVEGFETGFAGRHGRGPTVPSRRPAAEIHARRAR
jgi:ATP-dependent RNA helicase RhlE